MGARLPNDIYKQLWQRNLDNTLPHALLFVGSMISSKLLLADYFSKALLCDTASIIGEGCGKCHSCHLFEAKSHPNMLYVLPEKDGQAIKIDQIRELNDFVHQTSLKEGRRIIVVNSADDMNDHASNALLKTLEEPAAGAMFILLNQQRGRIPSTITSRCQRVIFPEPDRHAMLNELSKDEQQLRVQLFKLLSESADPIEAASLLYQNQLSRVLEFMLTWLVGIIRLQMGGDINGLYNPDYLESMTRIRQQTSVEKNLTMLDYLQKIRAEMFSGINFNKQLMIEELLIRWRGCLECI